MACQMAGSRAGEWLREISLGICRGVPALANNEGFQNSLRCLAVSCWRLAAGCWLQANDAAHLKDP